MKSGFRPDCYVIVHERPDDRLPDDLLKEAQKAVGRALRDHRESLGLSQGELGTYAGVHQSEWSRLEAGAIDPRLSWLLRAQHLFGLESIETLFGPLPTRRLLGSTDSDQQT
jgi:DNA-binding XRE family transcriptional regulator